MARFTREDMLREDADFLDGVIDTCNRAHDQRGDVLLQEAVEHLKHAQEKMREAARFSDQVDQQR